MAVGVWLNGEMDDERSGLTTLIPLWCGDVIQINALLLPIFFVSFPTKDYLQFFVV
jgi:hypothetical protein